MPLLFLLFLTVPALELFLLIEIGSHIGALNTVAIVFVTAALGATLLRREGLQTIVHAQQRMAAGEAPARELVEGALLVFAGTLLLTPGFLTDLVGLSCLVPAIRARIAGAMLKRIVVEFGEAYVQTQYRADFQQGRGTQVPPSPFTTRPGNGPGRVSDDIIEGEFQRKD